MSSTDTVLARGMRLVLADIDEPKLRAVESRLTEAGGEVAGTVCDTASADSVTALAEATPDRFGAAHLLFNNAGIAGVGDAWAGPLELWDRVGVENGIPAAEVADRFVAAVDDEQFWILTHEDTRQLPLERMQRAASQTNPPLMGTS